MCNIFRALKPSEVECRIGSVIVTPAWQGVMLLLYKNARVDMNILDETVGIMDWQRIPEEINGNFYCRVGINRYYNDENHDPEWVWKSDCGAESNTDKEKGAASDAFKRACVNWGIGRELYTAPPIMIAECNIDTKNGKSSCKDRFYVREMDVEDGEITHLIIYNAAKNIRKNVYEYSKR